MERQGGSGFGQLALRRLFLSAPEHASGCPKPRLAIGRVFLTGATSEDLTLSVSIVVLFTLLFQFVQPYLALAVGMSHLTLTLALGLTLTIPNPNPDQVGMSHDVAGAWIGASVDQTGNDIYSKW